MFDAAPDNHGLRRAVYLELAARGHVRAVEDLAHELVVGNRGTPLDLAAWLRAWQQRATTRAAAAELVAAAEPLLPKAGNEPAVYLCLGQALALAFPDRELDARRCFERVLQIAPYGPFAELAKAALGQR